MMRRSVERAARGLTGLLTVTIVLAGTVAAAQSPSTDRRGSADVRTARSHFQQGVALYYEGDHSAALVEFRRAYSVAPHFQILYNIGACHFALKDYARALAAYRQHLKEGKTLIDAEARKKVESEVRLLRRRTARLTLQVDPVGTVITIDGAPVGQSPLRKPVIVNTGRHRVEFTHPDAQSTTRWIEVAGGDEERLSVVLEPKAAAPPPVDALALTAAAEPSSNTPLYVSLTLTGVLASAAAVTGVLALQASGRRDDIAAAVPVDPVAYDRQDDRAMKLGIATDILIGTAAVSALTSLYFALSGDDAESVPVRGARPQAGVAWRSGGVVLTTQF